MRRGRFGLMVLVISVGMMGVGLAQNEAAPVDRQVQCQADKLKVASQYAGCVLLARADAVIQGATSDFTACQQALQVAIAAAGTTCAGDATSIAAGIDAGGLNAANAVGKRFVNNNDGTITDVTSGLMWEKKVSGSGCLHCVDDSYSWTAAMSDFISQVNSTSSDGSTQAGLAGHTDWRLPTITELKTLLLVPYPCFTVPCVDPVFNNGTDSFTAVGAYWSSTTLDNSPVFAWLVSFGNGVVADNDKSVAGPVRAVRGGQ